MPDELKTIGSVVLRGYNVNGRIYPREVVEKALKKFNEIISQNRAIGFTIDENTEYLNLVDRASHFITYAACEDDGVHISVKPISTHWGRLLTPKTVFNTVSRGELSTKDGVSTVVSMEIISIDAIKGS